MITKVCILAADTDTVTDTDTVIAFTATADAGWDPASPSRDRAIAAQSQSGGAVAPIEIRPICPAVDPALDQHDRQMLSLARLAAASAVTTHDTVVIRTRSSQFDPVTSSRDRERNNFEARASLN